MKHKLDYTVEVGSKVEVDNSIYLSFFILRTRRLKSFPWDALVHGSIMAFYLKARGRLLFLTNPHPLFASSLSPTPFDTCYGS